jgi:hypothetical protein
MPNTNINECEPKLYFPLTVTCQGTNPSSSVNSDGDITLLVNGGTPPYDISWSNNNYGTTITNLSAGNYTAIVIDYYGTSAKTTCVLVNPTTTTTTTTTEPPPGPTTYNMCMTVKSNTNVITQTQYSPNGLYSGKQSWISGDGNTKIVWNSSQNYWFVSGSSSNIISSTTQYPPIVGWQFLGNPPSTVLVSTGTCTTQSVSSFNYTLTQPTCSNDGGITFSVNGPNTPFQYSINGGLNYFNTPNFNNLGGGTYTLFVKDSLNNTSSNVVTLNNPLSTTTFTLNVTKTNSGTNTIINFSVVPTLPNGVSLTFNVSYLNIFTRTPQLTTATENYGIIGEINNSTTISPTTTTTNDSTTPNTNTSCTTYSNYLRTTTNGWNSVTLTGSDTFKITSSSAISINGCVGDGQICCSASSSSTVNVTNVTVTGCDCCDATLNKNF